MMKKTLVLAVLLATFNLSACFSRTISAVEEHPTAPLMLLTTSDDLNLWVYRKVTTQFWECTEKKDSVACKKACGGDTDLECPAATGALGAVSNNFSSSSR